MNEWSFVVFNFDPSNISSDTSLQAQLQPYIYARDKNGIFWAK